MTLCWCKLKQLVINTTLEHLHPICWQLKWPSFSSLRCDMSFLAFSFPRSLGSGVYNKINGGQRKLVHIYLSYISTKFQPIWMSSGTRVSKTPCQTCTCVPMGLAWCFAYACTKTHPNRLKFGGDIAQISAHQFSLSSINCVINSTPQGPWERKGQKTCLTPYSSLSQTLAPGWPPEWLQRLLIVL